MRNFTTSLQLIAATAMLTATGCTPAIYTNIQKSYPARTEESPVLVYDLADTVPAPAQTLGSVWIKDSGFSTGCSYENIIRLAKNETNKIGGNGLHVVWHKKPAALGKSCHQISADMLLLPDSVYTASYARNAEAQQVRIAQYSGTPEIVPADKTDPERKKVNPRYNILHASAGYSMLTSEFKFPRNCDGDPNTGSRSTPVTNGYPVSAWASGYVIRDISLPGNNVTSPWTPTTKNSTYPCITSHRK